MLDKKCAHQGRGGPGIGGHTGLTRAGGPQQDPRDSLGATLAWCWAGVIQTEGGQPRPLTHTEINRLLPAASNVHTWERLGFTDSVFQQREDKFLGQSGNPTAGHLLGQDLLVQIPGVR